MGRDRPVEMTSTAADSCRTAPICARPDRVGAARECGGVPAVDGEVTRPPAQPVGDGSVRLAVRVRPWPSRRPRRHPRALARGAARHSHWFAPTRAPHQAAVGSRSPARCSCFGDRTCRSGGRGTPMGRIPFAVAPRSPLIDRFRNRHHPPRTTPSPSPVNDRRNHRQPSPQPCAATLNPTLNSSKDPSSSDRLNQNPIDGHKPTLPIPATGGCYAHCTRSKPAAQHDPSSPRRHFDSAHRAGLSDKRRT
ncbi:hypothetical protein APR09_000927 [Nocardia amikacinitolerans]|nr:hypothetical protein [Nocardia amikacinitolerans]